MRAGLPSPCFLRMIKPLYSSSRKIRVALWRLRWSFVCACSKVKYSRIVPSGFDVAVLSGNAGSVQQQRVEHFCVVADVPQGFILEKEPWKRHIGRRWALRRELAKIFHLTSYPIHQSIHFCVD